MMVFKKSISRRTMLRGIGATVALPLLDAMVQAENQIPLRRMAQVAVLSCITDARCYDATASRFGF